MVELLYKEFTFAVIGAAMEVHRILGPGFLESVYQTALERELALRGIAFERKVKLPVIYKDLIIGDYEADLVIDKKFIVEIKAIARLNSSHDAQAMHYWQQQDYGLPFYSTSELAHWSIAESSNKPKEKSVRSVAKVMYSWKETLRSPIKNLLALMFY